MDTKVTYNQHDELLCGFVMSAPRCYLFGTEFFSRVNCRFTNFKLNHPEVSKQMKAKYENCMDYNAYKYQKQQNHPHNKSISLFIYHLSFLSNNLSMRPRRIHICLILTWLLFHIDRSRFLFWWGFSRLIPLCIGWSIP